MKAKLTKVLSLVLVVIMALSLMTGCSTSSSGKGTKTQDGNKVLFSYDGTDVTLKEAWLRCLAHSMSRLTAVTMEVTSGVCPWVKTMMGMTRHLKSM